MKQAPMDLTRWLRPIGITAAAGVALYAIALAIVQPDALPAALAQIGYAELLIGSAVSLATLLLRFLRWQWQLQRLGHRLAPALGLRIYAAGIALSWTPGKLGETLRSALLRPHRVPVADSLGLFLADRLADVLGVALMGLLAAAIAGRDATLFITILALALPGSLLLAHGMRGGWLPGRRRRWLALQPLARWADIWTPLRTQAWTLIGLLAYGAQALVFAMLAMAVAPDIGVAACVAAFAAAIFVGAASLVPAGLGVMEATLAYSLTTLGVDWSNAVAVALLTRLCTLWVPTGLGVAALLSLVRLPSQPLSATQA